MAQLDPTETKLKVDGKLAEARRKHCWRLAYNGGIRKGKNVQESFDLVFETVVKDCKEHGLGDWIPATDQPAVMAMLEKSFTSFNGEKGTGETKTATSGTTATSRNPHTLPVLPESKDATSLTQWAGETLPKLQGIGKRVDSLMAELYIAFRQANEIGNSLQIVERIGKTAAFLPFAPEPVLPALTELLSTDTTAYGALLETQKVAGSVEDVQARNVALLETLQKFCALKLDEAQKQAAQADEESKESKESKESETGEGGETGEPAKEGEPA